MKLRLLESSDELAKLHNNLEGLKSQHALKLNSESATNEMLQKCEVHELKIYPY
jgi:hypothetical protein